ncbi:gamma-glutamyltransferase [Suhomyces tanzawaensis NRRL Y-17324]|uniref:Gamma-glutamyltransferase n=1 Tax=Suhomyces tanzawaensis NRRL Y-17324 TaxID=984487 RepID=A0A1E4SML9_9ASCO|nr:gamma-glutamyltransferase [Suhomyces tanzawaensis NRRL Y-17324]ODV80657.1 gamma-glutamyltransferase [Suhomyces tanzawaensis NRRL Y-17324]
MSFPFYSRRSTVYSSRGMVASTQALANAAGVRILEKGGNCVDAAIAVSAALCVSEPTSTGIGGDCFALYYKKGPAGGQVLGLNATGRAALAVTIQDVWDHHNHGQPMARIPYESVFSVTVPGAIAGWHDAWRQWGSGTVAFHELLQPAVDMAQRGFPVAEVLAHLWQRGVAKLQRQSPVPNPFIVDGRAPYEGDVVTNTPVAEALKLIGQHGKDAFYKGPIGDALVAETSSRGHKLSHHDLASHTSTFVEPLSVDFWGYQVWEIPPNGHGIVALMALGMIQTLHDQGTIDLTKMEHNLAEYLHVVVEVCKLAFYDSDEYVTDPQFHDIPVEHLVSRAYLRQRAKQFAPGAVVEPPSTMRHAVPNPRHRSDTVYLTVGDANGEACSFINSVYRGFGSGIVVPEYGFCLHNRGANFNLTAGAPNSLEGGKRPYHTIIPGMITKNGELYASFGNMGGFAQPICHVQHVVNMTVFGMTPQQLVDALRVVLSAWEDEDAGAADSGRGADGPVSTPRTEVHLEAGIAPAVVQQLSSWGHYTREVTGSARSTFGRAQIIQMSTHRHGFTYAGGSDPRGDGAAVALV